MLNIKFSRGKENLARVYIAELADGSLIEFAESIQPPEPREKKWVLIVSTLKGCPIKCPICDAGGNYQGRLTKDEILAQVDYLVRSRFPTSDVIIPKLKIQFARMGEPAFNTAVLETMEQLSAKYPRAGIMPCISTVAPKGCESFFDRLLEIKNSLYAHGRFQMQFSIHTSDENTRRKLIPAKIWSFEEIAAYSERFFSPGDRKITLNFAPAKEVPLEPKALASFFSPERFLIKLTPINPTLSASISGFTSLVSYDTNDKNNRQVVEKFQKAGYDVILSIGELEENVIGSNCGMFVSKCIENTTSDLIL